ncbi:MAG: hypothetical protein B6D63_02185 [Candidatus Latescibacteria bacterium 4484_7]|nr:MAG: hypothetical protein B6D63_02185 [Candidatus Latescibacteria bacterium 4484_7]RKZ05575.1 MAG: hypothetical protein DRQ05_06210 [bacterium]
MFFRVFGYAVKKRGLIFKFTFFVLIASIVFAAFTHRKYSSSVLLMPPIGEGGEGILTAWMAQLNLPSMISPMTSGATTAQVLADIMESRRLADMLITRLDLKTRFKVEATEDAVKALRARTRVTVTQTGLIKLRVSDEDPVLARDIAAGYVAGLDSLNRFLNFSRAVHTKRFINGQLVEYRAKLDSLRSEISDFQRKNGIVNFDDQVSGAIDLASEIKLRAVLAGIEKDLLKEFTKENSLELKRKEAEYRFLNEQLDKVMNGDSSEGVFVPLVRLPELQKRYAEMQRDLEVSEKVYSFLLQRYEETSIEAARNTPSVQVVDKPDIPERASGLSRKALVALITVVGFIWICGVVMWWGWISESEKSDREAQAFEELREIAARDLERLRSILRL